MRHAQEEYYDDYEEAAPSWRPSRLVALIGLLLLVALLVGAVWYAYRAGMRAGSDSGVPMVTAEAGPIKVRPADPGGLEVPHQNVLVYDRFGSPQAQPAKRPAERLLPRPEVPVSHSTIPMPPVAPETAPAEPPAVTVDRAVPQEGVTQGLPTGSATQGTIEGPPTPAEAPVVTAMTPLVPASIGPGYRVQLASLRSEAEATEVWERLQRNYPGLLSKLQPQINRTDLGPNRGVYYRLQAGPLSEKILAEMLCGELKSRKVDCLLVQP